MAHFSTACSSLPSSAPPSLHFTCVWMRHTSLAPKLNIDLCLMALSKGEMSSENYWEALQWMSKSYHFQHFKLKSRRPSLNVLHIWQWSNVWCLAFVASTEAQRVLDDVLSGHEVIDFFLNADLLQNSRGHINFKAYHHHLFAVLWNYHSGVTSSGTKSTTLEIYVQG